MLQLNIVVTCPEKECCCLGLHSIWLNHKFACLYIDIYSIYILYGIAKNPLCFVVQSTSLSLFLAQDGCKHPLLCTLFQ
jgi:hypothetical protein